MRVYLSGPMTGLPNDNFDEFNRVAEIWRQEGYRTYNPADRGRPAGWTWIDYLRDDLREISASDALAVLPGWESSHGAQLEVHIAERLEMPIFDALTFEMIRTGDVSSIFLTFCWGCRTAFVDMLTATKHNCTQAFCFSHLSTSKFYDSPILSQYGGSDCSIIPDQKHLEVLGVV